MRDIPAIAAEQFGVFTRAQALDAGWTRSALLHAASTGRLLSPRPGTFVPVDGLTRADDPAANRQRLAVATAAALLRMPAAVASHASAAVLAQLPIWRMPGQPCLTVPPQFTGDTSGVHLHRAGRPHHHLRPAGQLVRTSIARTVVDLAREHGVENAVVTGDAALHGAMLDIADLQRCLLHCANWPGIRRAREAVQLLDARAESPLESVSRLRLITLNVPAPQLQTEIYDADGVWLARVDFYWDGVGVVGEVDGKAKYIGDALWAEKLR